jgi:hypothetical protein
MEIYVVQEFSMADYDFSADVEYHGAYINIDDAKEKAKSVFESLKEYYADDIEKYTRKEYEEEDDEEDSYEDYFDEDGEVEFDIDEEKGYYELHFGSEEDFELHRVEIKECILHE